MANLNEVGLARFWKHILTKLSKKVDIEEGKGLSSNDYSNEEKNKVSELQKDISRISVELEEVSNFVKEESETDLSQYLRCQDNEVELGHKENQYKLQVDNDGVDILQGNTSMTHIGQNTVSAPTLEAARTVKIGNHTAKVSTSGALMFN
jgi:TolA-binding protein